MGRTLGNSGLSSYAIALEAWRRGLEVTFTGKDLHLFTVSDGRRNVDFNFSRPDSITSREDYSRLDRKSETNALLRGAGIPAPQGFLLDATKTSDEKLRALSSEIGFPLVLKPDSGSMGQGVLTGLNDWVELKSAYDYLAGEFKARKIVLEKHYEGDDYRVLIVGERVVGAVRRVPAHVIGDGTSSIADLIGIKNIKRKRNPFLSSGLIKIDFEVTKCLEGQGLSLKDVPKRGAQVVLRRVANASAGGDVFDVTDQLPNEIKQAAVQAVKKLPGIVIAGVDILYKTGQPASRDNYVIIEINSRPQIGVNMYPTSGTGRDAPLVIVDTLFPGTRRRESESVRTIRFNETAIRAALLSGIASKVTLPRLPSHLYPFRAKFRYEGSGGPVELRPFSGQALQKTARFYGLAGSITFAASGDMDLIVAAESRAAAEALVRRVSEFCSLDPTREDPWEGPVTTGFTIAK